FYTQKKSAFYFASELKSFAAAGLALDIDPASVASFLRFAYVPAPFAIYRDVHQVLPGEVVSIRPDGQIRRQKYWDLVARAAQLRPGGSPAHLRVRMPRRKQALARFLPMPSQHR